MTAHPPQLGDMVYLIASWPDPNGKVINVQDFVRDGVSYIPIFSHKDGLRAFVKGTQFEHRMVGMDVGLLFSFLNGEERLELDPHTGNPVGLTKQDLAGLGRYRRESR